MTKLAEIAARSTESATFTWAGPNATDFAPATTVWTGDTTIKSAAQADEKPNTFRAELFATPHLMPVNGGLVHYGTPDGYGNTDLPICRQSHGGHRVSYYRPVDLPVTCTNCISRYGTEA